MYESVVSGDEIVTSSVSEIDVRTNTAIRMVVRRDGRVDHFDSEKITRSIQAALSSSGLIAEQLDKTTHIVRDRVLQIIEGQFESGFVPSTRDIHDMVTVAFVQLGHAHAAQLFLDHKQHTQSNITMEPTSPLVDSTPHIPPVVDPYGAPRRHRLNDERKAITHKFQIGNHEGYLTVGMYDDTRQPGEIFVTMSKEGTVMSGLVDAFATSISIGLQYGVPLKVYVNKFANMRFEPSGPTQNPNIPAAKSIVDYIFRWLAMKFLTPEERQAILMSPESNPSGILGFDGGTSAQTRLIDSHDGTTIV